MEIQHQLFNLGGELSIPGFELLKADAVLALDEALAAATTRQLPKLQEFILPAGNRAASQAHVCRTVARRAERAVVALGARRDRCARRRGSTSTGCRDLMFVLARVFNRMNGGDDVYWKSERLARERRWRGAAPRRRPTAARSTAIVMRDTQVSSPASLRHVDLPDLRAAPDVHRPRDAGDPALRSRRAGGWR